MEANECWYMPSLPLGMGYAKLIGGMEVGEMAIALGKEYQLFKEHRDELLAKGEGKFVLIKGETIVNIFASYEDALKEGLARFGNVPFLIKEVRREEDVNFFYTHFVR